MNAWLFTAIESGFQSFSLFQDGTIQILEVSGCFRTVGPVFHGTDFQSFRMVQGGLQDVSGWRSTFSLLSTGILSGSSGGFRMFQPFRISFSRSG